MKASEKLETVEQYLTKIFGYDRRRMINENKCVFCNHQITAEELENYDKLSLKEFCISALCLDCQNKVFGNN